MRSYKFFCEAQGGFDVLCLGPFVPAGRQNGKKFAKFFVVDPIAWTVIDS